MDTALFAAILGLWLMAVFIIVQRQEIKELQRDRDRLAEENSHFVKKLCEWARKELP